MSSTSLKSGRKYAVVVQGLFEKSDSIGYDSVFQYKILSSLFGEDKVDLFAEKFDNNKYPGININPISKLYKSHADYSFIVYHFCDGWNDFDNFISSSNLNADIVVRWHNNTPHWFYAPYDMKVADRCVSGFENISRILQVPGIKFWVNSKFTENQLVAFGAARSRISVVYPGSRYVEADVERRTPAPKTDEIFRMLFVGRVVAHKGHLHCIALAEKVHQKLGKPVELTFMGRSDKSAGGFNQILADRIAAVTPGVKVTLLGEVDENILRAGYASADAFVCLSEHEGFGLPVFEAMLCGVPVVSCSRTAMTELLSWHPLSVPEMDLDVLAAKVAVLSSAQAVQDIVSKQYEVAQQYSHALLTKQIAAAIAGTASPLLKVPESANEVNSDLACLNDGTLFDYGENFVTTYDIASMRSALEQGGALVSKLEGTYGSEKLQHITLTAKEFNTIGGHKEADRITFPLNMVDGHVVFGPYLRLPQGFYEVEFLLEGPSNLNVMIDVLADGNARLARAKAELGHSSMRLSFATLKENSIIEFRVKLEEARKGTGSFTGVRLSRGARPEQLVEREIYKPDRPYAVGVRKFLSRLLKLNSKATGLFKQADAARDAGDFEGAINLYRQGLDLAPQNRPYWVQLGNVLRDAGRLQEAMASYKSAAGMGAIDSDLHLQMGRTYAALGQHDLSESHLWASLRVGHSTLEALKEIAKRQSVSADEVANLIK